MKIRKCQECVLMEKSEKGDKCLYYGYYLQSAPPHFAKCRHFETNKAQKQQKLSEDKLEPNLTLGLPRTTQKTLISETRGLKRNLEKKIETKNEPVKKTKQIALGEKS